MAESIFPRTITGFTEFIKIGYNKAEENLEIYGIPPHKLTAITPLYNAYIQAEAIAANPDTATTGARRARDNFRKTLEYNWRIFLNENIRYNSAVSIADREVFNIRKRSRARTLISSPDVVAALSIRQVGTRRLEVEVLNGETGKRKKPQHAAGSYVYLAVTEVGQIPQQENEYRKLDFSSVCRHIIEFPLEQLAKQAHLYARYSNSHGKEGPKSITESVVIS